MKKLSLFLIISKLAFAQTIRSEEALNQTIENCKNLQKQKTFLLSTILKKMKKIVFLKNIFMKLFLTHRN